MKILNMCAMGHVAFLYSPNHWAVGVTRTHIRIAEKEIGRAAYHGCSMNNTRKRKKWYWSLYETFSPEQAFRLSQRLEIYYTPKHGSWLNIAEVELAVLDSQCLGHRRIGDLATLNSELVAWSTQRNQSQKDVDWQFTTADARIKLKRLYPLVV